MKVRVILSIKELATNTVKEITTDLFGTCNCVLAKIFDGDSNNSCEGGRLFSIVEVKETINTK